MTDGTDDYQDDPQREELELQAHLKSNRLAVRRALGKSHRDAMAGLKKPARFALLDLLWDLGEHFWYIPGEDQVAQFRSDAEKTPRQVKQIIRDLKTALRSLTQAINLIRRTGAEGAERNRFLHNGARVQAIPHLEAALASILKVGLPHPRKPNFDRYQDEDRGRTLDALDRFLWQHRIRGPRKEDRIYLIAAALAVSRFWPNLRLNDPADGTGQIRRVIERWRSRHGRMSPAVRAKGRGTLSK